MALSVSYLVLSEILINENKEAFFTFIKTTFKLSEDSFELYRQQLNQFVKNHDFRWKKKSKCRKDHFRKQYGPWLQQNFSLKNPQKKRELKPFDQCSERTKKRRLLTATENGEPGPSSSSSVLMKKEKTAEGGKRESPV